MGALSGEPVRGAAGYAPLVVRVLVGLVMAAYGWQKLQGGPANFGQALAGLGVPLPTLMAYVDVRRAHRRHPAYHRAAIEARRPAAHYRPRHGDSPGEGQHWAALATGW